MKLKVFTDGGARGNPGPAATGYVIHSPTGEQILSGGTFLGLATNNLAEYQAVLDALNEVILYKKNQNLETLDLAFHLDSLLVVNQLNGNYKIKNPQLKQKALQIQQLISQHKLKASFTHIPRAQNQQADSIYNQVIDSYLSN
jgi:ribonuclease HI